METQIPPSNDTTGHNRHLRGVLRAAREKLGLTQQQVADRITERLQLEKPLSGSTVSEWERFGRHPAINLMHAWSRVVGLRLLVDLDAGGGDRIPVLIRPQSADLCRMIDVLSEEDQQTIRNVASHMKPRRDLV